MKKTNFDIITESYLEYINEDITSQKCILNKVINTFKIKIYENVIGNKKLYNFTLTSDDGNVYPIKKEVKPSEVNKHFKFLKYLIDMNLSTKEILNSFKNKYNHFLTEKLVSDKFKDYFKYEGEQDDGRGGSFPLFTLLQPVLDLTVGSTYSKNTLKRLNINIPDEYLKTKSIFDD